MIVYRVCHKEKCLDLSGVGAKLNGGRWNSIGNSLLYTSQSRALSCLEVAVHLPLGRIPNNYFIISLEIPKNTTIIEVSNLPKNWNSIPFLSSTQLIGDHFLKKNNALVLKVPSVVISDEFNYLINPQHPDFKKIKIIEKNRFVFDPRL